MKIGILQTGIMVPELAQEHGQYPEMFMDRLSHAGFTFETWSVVNGEFPPGPEAADGWLITGSRHGVYEDHAWLPPLEEFIRQIVAAGKPLVGICFGHQVIAQALGARRSSIPAAGRWGHRPTNLRGAGRKPSWPGTRTR
ncbi:hypothetical protein KU6B_37330 [Mameliella alba]|nr:hypothetical protein KU6B_37330 [Mameliella alba]